MVSSVKSNEAETSALTASRLPRTVVGPAEIGVDGQPLNFMLGTFVS